MSSLRGRLTGHFLGRVFAAHRALSAVFMIVARRRGVHARADEPRAAVTPAHDDAAGGRRPTRRSPPDGAPLDRCADARDARGQGQWLQVLDESGDESRPQATRRAGVPRHYTPGRLVEVRSARASSGMMQLFTWSATVGGPRAHVRARQERDRSRRRRSLARLRYAAQQSQFSTMALVVGFLVAGAATTLVVAWLSGSALARPLVHMMEWLRGLAAGRLRASRVDRDGQPGEPGRAPEACASRFRDVSRGLRGPGHAHRRAARAEDERGRLERAREEWMAGVSHDLRTPLSSVRGYAEVLASDYDFDSAEVRRQADRHPRSRRTTWTRCSTTST